MVGRLLQLNGVAILGVILFHTAGWGFVAMFAWSHRYLPAGVDPMVQMGSFSYYVLRGIEQFAVFSIPAFLFVSGYFIAFATPRRQATVSWSIVWARIRGLLIPYLIWSLVLIVFLGFQGRRLSPAGYATALLTGRVNPAYYYVPLLCQFYLLSPLLVFLARRWWQWLLLAALAIQLSIQLLYYPALLQVSAGVLQPYVDVVPKWIFPVRIFWRDWWPVFTWRRSNSLPPAGNGGGWPACYSCLPSAWWSGRSCRPMPARDGPLTGKPSWIPPTAGW